MEDMSRYKKSQARDGGEEPPTNLWETPHLSLMANYHKDLNLTEIGTNGYSQLRLRSLKVSVHGGAVQQVVHYNNCESRYFIGALYCNILFCIA